MVKMSLDGLDNWVFNHIDTLIAENIPLRSDILGVLLNRFGGTWWCLSESVYTYLELFNYVLDAV